MDPISNLADLLSHCWQQLTRARHDRHSPFRLATLATLDLSGAPALRMVVMRSVSRADNELGCYTDLRSAKVGQLQADPRASLLFWDKKHSLQIRAAGIMRLADQDTAEELFDRLSKNSRTTYATRSAPGTSQPGPTDDLPPDWENLDLAETDFACANFQPLLLSVTSLDVLQLGRPRHLRAQYVLSGNEWQGEWVTP
ncbi:MAG: pyridoxamine 5'-phosphate oxidase family protein [Saprospiraceae bacterium]